jgi:hypothetical protein
MRLTLCLMLAWTAPAVAEPSLPIDGYYCPVCFDSEGFPPGEFKIGPEGFSDDSASASKQQLSRMPAKAGFASREAAGP